MPTVSVNLDTNQYIQVNTAFNPMVLQAHRDEVRITLSEAKPSVSNPVFHLLGGGDASLHLHSIDTNVWALALTAASSLIVSETEPYPIAVHDGFGNPISSLDGALDSHDADPHHAVYNQFLHFDTVTTTTLVGAASKGGNQITLVSTVGFAVNDEIKIEDGTQEPVFFSIITLVGALATLDTPLTFDHPSGSNVTKIHTNLAEAGITTGATLADPVVFTSHITADSIVHITNMSVVITDTAAMDFTKWGGAVALVNGLVLRAQSDGSTGAFTNWKRNFDMDSDTFAVNYQVKTGGGEYGLSAIYQIKTNTGAIVYLDGSLGDAFEALAQESLEANTVIKIKLQGHYEG